MTINQIIMYLMAFGAALGGIDQILGNRFGYGEKFENGFRMLGPVALAMAGDIGDFGDRSQVRIVREKEGVTDIKTFDVRSNDIINSEFYYIEPNDVIYIQRIKGQSFGINSVTTTISVVATTLAFGGFVYGLVTRIINSVEDSQTE